MNMPEPTPGHLLLEKFAGTWTGEEVMHPCEWNPEAGTALGRNKNAMSLNGFALLTDYEQECEGAITFTGHGVYTFNPEEGNYSLHWFDCMGSPPEVFVGDFENEVLTLVSQTSGKHARMTYDFSAAETVKGTMMMSADGETWQVVFEGTYRRVSD